MSKIGKEGRKRLADMIRDAERPAVKRLILREMEQVINNRLSTTESYG